MVNELLLLHVENSELVDAKGHELASLARAEEFTISEVETDPSRSLGDGAARRRAESRLDASIEQARWSTYSGHR